jgi:transcriptional regulator GlxA family with amidase domain
MNTRCIGLFGFDGVTALDIVGPVDVFATAADLEPAAKGGKPYRIVILGATNRPFTSDAGLVFTPERSLRDAPALDTLVIPGGEGLRRPDTNARIVSWLRLNAGRVRRVVTVCTGIYGLAPTGLLDGRRVTTHWRYAEDVARKFPALKVEPDSIFIKDGRFYTAAGVTSGIDLSLALVQEDLGPQAALAVARMLVVYMKRTGGQGQFSEPLRFQTRSSDHFSELSSWMAGNLGGDLSVETLARRAGICPRHFSRRFKRSFGDTPASFVEAMRLDEARRLLTSDTASIEGVAETVGFGSADSFRRAFERRFGITPTGYRGRFSLQGAAS